MSDLTSHPEPVSHRYLRVQDLRRLRHMFFSSRRVVEGQYAGRHASPQRGHSVEFNDYREYIPGDPLSQVDWKIFGRTDRLFIKLFEHQSDMGVTLLVDASASMAYRGLGERASPARSWIGRAAAARAKGAEASHDAVITNPSKYDQACLMAAAIAFLTTAQQDKVAMGMACEGLAQFHPPQGTFTHLTRMLETMQRTELGGEARLAEAMNELARRISRRGLVILFSDLLEDRDAVLRAISAFTARGNEVIVFQIMHAHEIRLPDLQEAIFVDSETNHERRVNVADIREPYEKRLRRFLDAWSVALKARGIDHHLVSTAMPYYKALEQYIFNRASMS